MNDPIRTTTATTTRLPRVTPSRSDRVRARARLAFGALLLACSAGGWAAQGGGANPTTIIFAPASVTLNTIVGTTSSVTVQLGDLTSQNLLISSITLAGANAADYKLSATCLAPGSVVTQKGGACQILVTFTPSALGARPATIAAVFGNAPSVNYPLNGTGISAIPGPAVAVISGLPPNNAVDAGPRPIGSGPPDGADLVLSIGDSGESALMFSESIIGPNSGDFVLSGFAPKGSRCVNVPVIGKVNVPCFLPVSFFPTALGTRTATLRIVTNDPTQATIDIQLTGVGTPALPAPPLPPPSSFTDVSGLWGNPAEPGWALGISHHKFSPATNVLPTDGLVAYWTTFDTTGQPVWFVLRDGTWTDSLNYTGGVIHRFTGSPFTGPYLQSQLTDTVVGSGSLTFTDSNTGTLNFTINGFAGSKPITKNPFNF